MPEKTICFQRTHRVADTTFGTEIINLHDPRRKIISKRKIIKTVEVEAIFTK